MVGGLLFPFEGGITFELLPCRTFGAGFLGPGIPVGRKDAQQTAVPVNFTKTQQLNFGSVQSFVVHCEQYILAHGSRRTHNRIPSVYQHPQCTWM